LGSLEEEPEMEAQIKGIYFTEAELWFTNSSIRKNHLKLVGAFWGQVQTSKRTYTNVPDYQHMSLGLIRLIGCLVILNYRFF
jgi:hypothetical protein